MHKIIYTPEAMENLDAIADFIAEDNFIMAIKFTQELQDSIENTLSIFPNSGEFHNKEKGIRKRNYKGYTAFYRVIDDVVFILNVVNLSKPLEHRGIEF